MKKLLFFLAVILLPTFAEAQIAIGKNAKLRKEYKQDREAQEQEGWDITPLPGEAPQDLTTRAQMRAAAVTNWGEQLVIPAAIRLRLVNECSQRVVIKIFDTSAGTNHPDLQQGQITGSNYAGGNMQDENGHGTHVAGIIAANGFGVLDGLIDKGLIMWKPVKVLSSSGSGQFAWIATAITTEDQDNARLLASGVNVVCTASLGGGTAKQANVEAALQASTGKGVIYTFASGNGGGPGVNYPGNSTYATAVGSLDNVNPLKHSSYTSTGPELWVGMPGSSIQSCWLNGGYATLSGTSMATPFAASCAAIALSKWGNQYLRTTEAMKRYLAWCALDLEGTGKDDATGYGIEMVIRVLDRNPKDTPPGDPGGGDPGTPPPHAVRDLSFSLTGSWPMYWNNDLGLSYEQTGGQPLMPVAKKAKLRAAGMDKLTITKLELRVPGSIRLSPIEYAAVKQNVDWYFSGRGLILSGGSDYNDATYWSAYFLELVVATQAQAKQKITVTRIEATDKNGKTCTIFEAGLKHRP